MTGIAKSVPPRSWGWAAIGLAGLCCAAALSSLVFWGLLGQAASWFTSPVGRLGDAVTVALTFHWDQTIMRATAFAALLFMMALMISTLGLGKAFGLIDSQALYGRARFGAWRELVSGKLLDRRRLQPGVLLGKWRRAVGSDPLVSHSEDWTHVFVLGPTGCGKGQGFVLPNGLAWPDSLIAFDLKGEAWGKTAGWRASQGQAVFYFNPREPERRTCRFNPLGHIDHRNAVQLVGEMKKVAEMLLPVPEMGEKFWAQSGQAGFVAAGMVIAERDGRLSIGGILEELKRPDLQGYFTAIATGRQACAPGQPFSRSCQLQCSAFAAGSDEKTFGSKRDTITAALGLWDDPNVCAATEASDFQLNEMRRRRISVYLCASAGELKVLRPLYATIFQQLYDQLTQQQPARTDHGVLVILDEFARLGAMPDLQAAFALTRSYKVRFLVVVQSLNQLKDAKLYNVHGAEDISINCDTQIYFTPTRPGDAKELSEVLGYNTVTRRSRSRQSRGGTSTSESEHQRALMLPQELMLYPESQILLKTRGRRPFRLGKLRAWRDEPFAERMALAAPDVEPLPVELPPLSALEALTSRIAAGALSFADERHGAERERSVTMSSSPDGSTTADEAIVAFRGLRRPNDLETQDRPLEEQLLLSATADVEELERRQAAS